MTDLVSDHFKNILIPVFERISSNAVEVTDVEAVMAIIRSSKGNAEKCLSTRNPAYCFCSSSHLLVDKPVENCIFKK